MAVIIRLQNLPLSANSMDIRDFFKGLKIPEGGVHIVGGEFGDAFIGFATDEDARQAMNLNNKKVKDTRIKLLLSSRTEMQNVILAARERQAKMLAEALNTKNHDTGTKTLSGGDNISLSYPNNYHNEQIVSGNNGNIVKDSKRRSRSPHTRDRSKERQLFNANDQTSRSFIRNNIQRSSRSRSPGSNLINRDPRLHRSDHYNKISANINSNSGKSPIVASYVTSSINHDKSLLPYNNQHIVTSTFTTPAIMVTDSFDQTNYNNSQSATLGNNSNNLNQYFTGTNVQSGSSQPQFQPSSETASMGSGLSNQALNFVNFQSHDNNASLFANSSSTAMMNQYTNYGNQMQAQPIIPPNNTFMNSNIGQLPLHAPLGMSQFSQTSSINSNMPYRYLEIRNLPPDYNISEMINFFSDIGPLSLSDMCPVVGNLTRIIIRVSNETAYQSLLAKNGMRYLGFRDRLEVVPSNLQFWITNSKTSTNLASPLSNTVLPSNHLNQLIPQASLQALNFSNTFNNFSPNQDSYGGGNMENENFASQMSQNVGYCARISNLSYETEPRDVQNFFKDFQLLNLYLEKRRDGKLTGTAFVEFSDQDQLENSLKLHRSRFLGRHIFIEEISKADVVDNVKDNLKLLSSNNHEDDSNYVNNNNFMGSDFHSTAIDSPESNGNSRRFSAHNLDVNQQNYTSAANYISATHVNFLPTNTRVSDIINHLSRFNFKPKEIHILRKNGVPVGQAFLEFFDLSEANRALSILNGNVLAPDTQPIKLMPAFNPKEVKQYILSQFDPINWLEDITLTNFNMGSVSSQFNKIPYNNPMRQHMNPLNPRAMMYNGSPSTANSFMRPDSMMNYRAGPQTAFGTHSKRTLIRLIIKNLPLDITPDEVIDICKPYRCVASSLQLPHTSTGKPLGEAVIGFPDPSLAQEAKHKLDNTSIKGHNISVTFQ